MLPPQCGKNDMTKSVARYLFHASTPRSYVRMVYVYMYLSMYVCMAVLAGGESMRRANCIQEREIEGESIGQQEHRSIYSFPCSSCAVVPFIFKEFLCAPCRQKQATRNNWLQQIYSVDILYKPILAALFTAQKSK